MPDPITLEQAQQIMAHARQAMTPGASAVNAEANPLASTALPKYGPHNPVLSDEQAHLLQLLWLVTGQNANTVGRGRVLQFSPVKHGSELDQYLGDEKSAAADSPGDPVASLPMDDQETYVDGIENGSITEPRSTWQRSVQDSNERAQSDAAIDRQNAAVYGGNTPGAMDNHNTQLKRAGGGALAE